jgi:hypothetical protein
MNKFVLHYLTYFQKAAALGVPPLSSVATPLPSPQLTDSSLNGPALLIGSGALAAGATVGILGQVAKGVLLGGGAYAGYRGAKRLIDGKQKEPTPSVQA